MGVHGMGAQQRTVVRVRKHSIPIQTEIHSPELSRVHRATTVVCVSPGALPCAKCQSRLGSELQLRLHARNVHARIRSEESRPLSQHVAYPGSPTVPMSDDLLRELDRGRASPQSMVVPSVIDPPTSFGFHGGEIGTDRRSERGLDETESG